MNKVTDESIMPFGKFEGEKMANVPAWYLLYAYKKFKALSPNIREYIEDNMEVLEKENPVKWNTRK